MAEEMTAALRVVGRDANDTSMFKLFLKKIKIKINDLFFIYLAGFERMTLAGRSWKSALGIITCANT